jgi:hypothetical protein
MYPFLLIIIYKLLIDVREVKTRFKLIKHIDTEKSPMLFFLYICDFKSILINVSDTNPHNSTDSKLIRQIFDCDRFIKTEKNIKSKKLRSHLCANYLNFGADFHVLAFVLSSDQISLI